MEEKYNWLKTANPFYIKLQIWRKIFIFKMGITWNEVWNLHTKSVASNCWNLYDAQTARHLGVRRTLDNITESILLASPKKICEWLCFELCKEEKSDKEKKTNLSGVKFERIAVDIAGPFPNWINGFVYILVIADYFTTFTELFPLRYLEAKTVANTMFRGWIKRWLPTGQGRHLFQELCELL